MSRRWLFNEWRHYVESGFFEEYQASDEMARLFRSRLRLKKGIGADDVVLPPLNYTNNARESYPAFARRKADGTLASSCRFLVCLPSPRTSTGLLEPESGEAAMPAHCAQLRSTIRELTEIVPPGDLAIQWDVVRETRFDLTPELIAELAALADWVPAEVDVGYHLCFGDRMARGDATARGMREQGMALAKVMESHERIFPHISPITNGMALLRDMSNSIIGKAGRPVNFMHLAALAAAAGPLDEAFQALGGLDASKGTEFYLGVLDIDGGLEGTRRQTDAVAKVLPRYGIGPECGLQRVDAGEYQLALDTLRLLAEELSGATPQ